MESSKPQFEAPEQKPTENVEAGLRRGHSTEHTQHIREVMIRDVLRYIRGEGSLRGVDLSDEEKKLLGKMSAEIRRRKDEQSGSSEEQLLEFRLLPESQRIWDGLIDKMSRIAGNAPRSLDTMEDDEAREARFSERRRKDAETLRKLREEFGIAEPQEGVPPAPTTEQIEGEEEHLEDIIRELPQPDYEKILGNLKFDESNPPRVEDFQAPAGGNMFEDADAPTLAGKVISRIYGKLVERPERTVEHSAEELIRLGKDGLSKFAKDVEGVNEALAKDGKKSFSVGTERKAGETGFHLNGDTMVTKDFLYYFNKSTREWKNQNAEDVVRAYVTLSPEEAEKVQDYFVELCKKLYDSGVDFNAKASSPAGTEARTDTMVFYISSADQPRASAMIKEFLDAKNLGRGHVAAAMPSKRDGLSWALEPKQEEHRLWQEASGAATDTSYNGFVATKIVPGYLRRLSEAHMKRGDTANANAFDAEAVRVEKILSGEGR